MKPEIERLFPRDLYGRIALALASLFFGPFCWLVAFGVLFGSRRGGLPNDVPGWLFLAVVEELFLSLALFFACGLVWALASPRWLERLLDAVAWKLVIALGLFLVPFCILAAWALIVG